MYSFHSSPEEKNKLLHSLTQYGIETTVDRGAKKDRIRAWIENSIIDEEEEDENEQEGDTDNEERVGLLDNETGPVGERMDRGPIQAKNPKIAGKTMDDKQKRREIRDAMINKRNSAIYIPPVDPRIPLEQQRLSKSEVQLEAVGQPHPNKYFQKFSSKIAMDLQKPPPMNQKSPPKNPKTTATTQTSVGSNNSNAQSDDSTIVNINSQDPDDPKQNSPSRKGSLTSRGTSRGSGNQNKATDSTQTSHPYANGQDFQRRDSGRIYQMKNRYDIYDGREEKSSSSISNSTGRSVSK